MSAFPDDDGVVAMDRTDQVGVPAFESAHGQAPQPPKVNDFVTGRVGIGQNASEALIAGSKLVD